MTKDQENLIRLLSLALGEKTNVGGFADVDWKGVLKQSYRQEVNSIAFDGYQKVHQALGDKGLCMDDLMDWLGQTSYQETQYESQQEAAKKLADLFDTNRLTTYVLKGASIAKCYPVPSHRYSCDFDCFLMSRSQNPNPSYNAQEIGNMLIEGQGITVDKSYYKDSSFDFDGLHVENHRFCCSIKRGKRTKELESYLQGLLKDYQPQYIEGTRLALPPLMFQALFLIEHACGHFLYEKMSLKNICDWAMFSMRYQKELDWKEFDTQCERFGLKRFADSMGRLGDYILGKIEYSELSTLDQRVLEDTLKEVNLPKDKMHQRIRKAMDVLCSGWKFRHFSSDSMIKELTNSFFAYLFEKEVEL